jgi:hypothetical protein
LEGKIQERYGYTRDRVRKELDDWYDSLASDLRERQEDIADRIDAIALICKALQRRYPASPAGRLIALRTE